MQGNQGPREKRFNPQDRSATAGHRLDLTGRQPVIPQRPPGMTRTRIDQPPTTPRVARPQHQESKMRKPRTARGWAMLFGCSTLALVVIALAAYGLTNLILAIQAASGPATTSAGFLGNIKDGDYDDAYKALADTLTLQVGSDDFKHMGQADDRCYGQITNYTEIDGSATSVANGTIQSYSYTLTRSKLSKPYTLMLTLKKNAAGDWEITSYGNDLGPATPSATCK